jgi:hypothetical protein
MEVQSQEMRENSIIWKLNISVLISCHKMKLSGIGECVVHIDCEGQKLILVGKPQERDHLEDLGLGEGSCYSVS